MGDDPPSLQDRDPIADVLDQRELVAGEHDRDAPCGLGAQDLGHGVDRHGVQTGERLVEDEQVGLVQQCHGQLHTLLVAQ